MANDSSLLGPDGKKLPAKSSRLRSMVQKVASSRPAWLLLGAALLWIWNNREAVKDLIYGRHPEVKILDVDINRSHASITITNEGDKPTVVTDAVIQITGVAKVTFDSQRLTAEYRTSRVVASHTYPIDLDFSTIEVPIDIVVDDFRHALVENEADSFDLDFRHRNNWFLEPDDESRTIVLGFRAQVTLLYENGRKVVSPPFVMRPEEFRLIRVSDVTDKEFREKLTEMENAVRELGGSWEDRTQTTADGWETVGSDY